MKTRLVFLSVAVILGLWLVGCGEPATERPGEEPTTVPETPVLEPLTPTLPTLSPGGRIRLTYWTLEREIVKEQALATRFMAVHPDIEVQVIVVDENFH